MRARDVSVGIQETPDGLSVMVRFYVKSAPLEREPACPEPSKATPELLAIVGTRVKESARKRKEKEIRQLLETVEFPDA